jgi:hypothetical protein
LSPPPVPSLLTGLFCFPILKGCPHTRSLIRHYT